MPSGARARLRAMMMAAPFRPRSRWVGVRDRPSRFSRLTNGSRTNPRRSASTSGTTMSRPKYRPAMMMAAVMRPTSRRASGMNAGSASNISGRTGIGSSMPREEAARAGPADLDGVSSRSFISSLQSWTTVMVAPESGRTSPLHGHRREREKLRRCLSLARQIGTVFFQLLASRWRQAVPPAGILAHQLDVLRPAEFRQHAKCHRHDADHGRGLQQRHLREREWGEHDFNQAGHRRQPANPPSRRCRASTVRASASRR